LIGPALDGAQCKEHCNCSYAKDLRSDNDEHHSVLQSLAQVGAIK